MRRITAFGGLLLVTACDLTHVAAPGVVQTSAFANPAGALDLRAGVIGAFASFWSLQVVESGLLIDEFRAAKASAASFPEDQRNLTYSNSTNYPYSGLSGARVNALNAITGLEQYAPTPTWRIGELYALVAATEIAFRENLCSGVPLATVSGSTPAYGHTLTSDQVIGQALADLDSAAKYAAGSDSITSLVAVLRGRALLDSGATAAAGTAAAGVPLTFAYAVPFNATTQQVNSIYTFVSVNQQMSVSNRKGTNGLPFVSAADPRVPTMATIVGSDTLYADANINAPAAPLLLTSGVEARLIVAEAALASGNVAAWADTLNALRAAAIVPAIAPLPADSTTTASPALQLAVHFRERAFWLFATGHRQGDVRRLVRYYGLPVTQVFPTGLYLGGPETYGTSVVFLPLGESADPNWHGCIDTNA